MHAKLTLLHGFCSFLNTLLNLINQIYVNANGYVYRVNPDGTRKYVAGSEGWGIVRGLIFYKNRLFTIWSTRLTEITESTYFYRSFKFAKCKTLASVNDNFLYTFEDSRLYRISFPSPNKPIKTAIGHYQINPSVVAGISPKFLFLVENGQYHSMDVQTGQGKELSSKGNPSAAVYCYGYLFIIDGNGDIRALNPATGEEVYRLTICGKFKGSRGLACYQNYLWAVGKDRKMYKIDPNKWDDVTQKGTLTYTNTGLMTSRE